MVPDGRARDDPDPRASFGGFQERRQRSRVVNDLSSAPFRQSGQSTRVGPGVSELQGIVAYLDFKVCPRNLAFALEGRDQSDCSAKAARLAGLRCRTGQDGLVVGPVGARSHVANRG